MRIPEQNKWLNPKAACFTAITPVVERSRNQRGVMKNPRGFAIGYTSTDLTAITSVVERSRNQRGVMKNPRCFATGYTSTDLIAITPAVERSRNQRGDVCPFPEVAHALKDKPVTPLSGDVNELGTNMTERLRRDFECVGLDYNAFYPGEVSLEAIENLLNAPEPPDEYQLFFYHSDHLGSSSFITDINGDATQHLQYLPFGEDFVHQQNTAAYYTPYTFSGKERDVETGLSYFGARYYEAGLSVWLSVDPMADKQINLSPYHYCAGNPVVLKDPDGKHPVLFMAVVGGLVEAGSQVVSNVTQGKSPFKDLDWADIVIAAAEGAYIGSGAGLVGKLVSSAGTAFLKASVDANSKGWRTIIPGLGKEKDKMDFGKELGASLIGGAFGRLFDSELGHMLLDGLIDGGLKEISTVLELKKGITLKEVVVKPDMTDEEIFKSIIKENTVLQEIHDMHPCFGCSGVPKPFNPDLQLDL